MEIQKRETLRKREEDERRRVIEVRKRAEEELKACNSIRVAVQKVRLATSENYKAVFKDLEGVLAKELDALGHQKKGMKEESDKALQLATKCIDTVQEISKMVAAGEDQIK